MGDDLSDLIVLCDMLLIKQIWESFILRNMTYFQTKDILELCGSASANLSILSSGHNFFLAWMGNVVHCVP